MSDIILEACLETIDEAIRAEEFGASRIELCGHLELDGLTPSLSVVQKVKSSIQIPIKVMVRPRSGNFVYSDDEILQMIETIEQCKKIGVFGVVLGCLNKDHSIDIENTKKLAKVAKPLNVCFHKAIDATPDIIKAVEQLSEIDEVDSILTSGGKNTAEEGTEILNQMLEVSKNRLQIVAAGKVTSKNIANLSSQIKTSEFHGKLIVGDLNS